MPMYTGSQQDLLENILKEIYAEIGKPKANTLYLKEKGKRVREEVVFSDPYAVLGAIYSLSSDIEYAMYIGAFSNVSLTPSKCCVKYKNYLPALRQFIGNIVVFDTIRWNLSNDLNNEFTRLLFNSFAEMIDERGENIFTCGPIHIIEPYSPDPASLFPNKYGVLTYCTTFSNYIKMLTSGSYTEYFQVVNDKLRDMSFIRIYNNKKIMELYEKDPVSACKLELIKEVVSDKIEEFNNIMKKYGIVRVAFPLDS